jgi:hypothetical protein
MPLMSLGAMTYVHTKSHNGWFRHIYVYIESRVKSDHRRNLDW